ncbi:MAG: hypothetical protein AAF740_01345 [Bacteroidota bacterium]
MSTEVKEIEKVDVASLVPVDQITELEAYKATNDTLSKKLESFSRIESDEQMKAANEALKEARRSTKQVEEFRKSFTRQLDDLKSQAMEKQKAVNKELDASVLRVKKLVNQYKAEVERQAEIERQRIAKEQARNTEMNTIRIGAANMVEVAIFSCVNRFEQHVSKAFDNLTLESVTKAENQVPTTPKLSQKQYEEIFSYPYKHISSEEYEAIMEELKTQFTYEKVNGSYKEKATAIQTKYRDQLPEKRNQLLEIQRLEKENKEAAEKKKRELEIEARVQRETKARLEQQRLEAERKQAKQDAQILGELEGMSQHQEIKTAGKVKRVATYLRRSDTHLEILKAAIESGYDSRGLDNEIQKAANWLANGSKPQILGVKYEVA